MEQSFEALAQMVESLNGISGGRERPELRELVSWLSSSFSKVAELSELQQMKLRDFAEQKQELKSKVQDITGWLAHVQERVAAVDVVSGSDAEILERFRSAQVCEILCLIAKCSNGKVSSFLGHVTYEQSKLLSLILSTYLFMID